MPTMTLVGMYGEVFVDSLYNIVFEKPLWEYHLFPIHNSYTSIYSLFIWSLYGFHLSLLHTFFEKKSIVKERTLSLIMSLEAIFLEIIFNLSFLFIFRDYIFYYLPGDMWHITSLQVMPIYFIAGLIGHKVLKKFSHEPLFFASVSLFLIYILLVI